MNITIKEPENTFCESLSDSRIFDIKKYHIDVKKDKTELLSI